MSFKDTIRIHISEYRAIRQKLKGAKMYRKGDYIYVDAYDYTIARQSRRISETLEYTNCVSM